MSLWLDILQHVAAGELAEAEHSLTFDLSALLRTAEIRPGGVWEYRGPLARRARNFIATLPDSERGMALSRSDDFIDYVTDLVVAKVRRSVRLLEYSLKYPDQSIEEMADRFTGWDGMKRSFDGRCAWIRKQLLSMSASGVSLSKTIADQIEADTTSDDDLYGYDEIALVNQWKMDLSWNDFRNQEEIDRSYVCVDDEDGEEEGGVADESSDYGGINAAQVVLHLSLPATGELDVDLNQIGQQLTNELLALLESFNAQKPTDGYSPIAWHNVWWKVVARYTGIPFKLSERDPFCSIDRELADHIIKNYPDVLKPNRLNILRRRTRLEGKCFEHSQAVLVAWASGDGDKT